MNQTPGGRIARSPPESLKSGQNTMDRKGSMFAYLQILCVRALEFAIEKSMQIDTIWKNYFTHHTIWFRFLPHAEGRYTGILELAGYARKAE